MKNNLNKQDGVAAIELTLILPFLLLMVFATVEFSRMIYQYNAINKVARDAARYLIVHGIDGSTQTVNIDTTDSLIASSLITKGDTGGSIDLLPNLSSAVITFSASSGNIITVKVVYNWQPIFFSVLPSFVGGSDIDLTFPLTVNYSMRALIS